MSSWSLLPGNGLVVIRTQLSASRLNWLDNQFQSHSNGFDFYTFKYWRRRKSKKKILKLEVAVFGEMTLSEIEAYFAGNVQWWAGLDSYFCWVKKGISSWYRNPKCCSICLLKSSYCKIILKIQNTGQNASNIRLKILLYFCRNELIPDDMGPQNSIKISDHTLLFKLRKLSDIEW